MIFNSIPFLIFLPIVLIMYYLIPKRFRYIWLLFCSYFFYLSQSDTFVILLILSTIITYFSGILLYKTDEKVKKNLIVAISFIINLGILFLFKYCDFALEIGGSSTRLNLILPIGISFYTFQSLGYVMDCYRREVEPEKNIFKYALFVSFFPSILSGPILRAKDMLGKFDCDNDCCLDNIKDGMILMLWGYFLKLVISARLTIWIDTVYADADSFSGATLLITALMYVLLVYSDFEGYSNLAIGAAKMLGIDIARNFRQPLLAVNFSDFWKRWHISLSSWFKDYMYIPLGGSRKGKARLYLNLMLVMLFSGIWHGANFTFIIWGLLNGLYQVIGNVLMPLRKKLFVLSRMNKMPRLHRVLQSVCVVLLYAFSFIFFAADNVSNAVNVVLGIFTRFDARSLATGQLFNVGLGTNNLLFVLFALLILFAADIMCEIRKCDVVGIAASINTYLRWAIYYVLIIMIIFSANLSGAEFIYSKM